MAKRRRLGIPIPTDPVSRAILMATLVLCFTLGATAFAYMRQQQQNIGEVSVRFERLRGRLLSEVALRMQQYEYGLRGTRGAVAAVGEGLNGSSFARYSASRNFDSEFPGARGFGFIRRVLAPDLPDFERLAQGEMGAGFKVRQMQPHSGDSFVIQYIEPLERNLPVLGLDIASEPVRKATALSAMRSGKATLSPPITLIQDNQATSSGLLLMLPVYRYGMPTNTEISREIALVGWVYAPLQMSEVLRNLDNDAQFFTMGLRDRAMPPESWLYGGEVFPAAGYPRQPVVTLELFGRQWEADVQPTPEFVDSLRLQRPERKALEAGLFGLLASALAVSVLHLAHRGRVQRLEQARRAAIVEGSEDAIIVQTLQGVITDWNDGATRLFGRSAAEALGHTAQELLVPEHLQSEDLSMLQKVARGEHVKVYETVRSHRDGSLIEVSISAGPIVDADGTVVGLAKTLRDVREARAAARQVAELNATLEDQVRERTADLESARHALQTVLDAMPSQIGYWGTDLRNRVANRAYGDWFRIDPQKVSGMHLRDLVGPRMFNISLPHVEAALRGEARTFEQTRPATEHSPARHMLVHYLPDVQEGAVKGFYAFVHDVTELTESRLQLAVAQRDNAALLQTLNQHALVSVADKEGRIIEVNDAFCTVSGYTRQELLGQNHRIVNSGVHSAAFWAGMWRAISSGQSWHAEVCNRAKDGSLYWVNSVVAPFMDAQGRVEKYVSIRTDITDRKRTELELQRALALLQAVLEASTQVAIVATDPRGVVSLLNRGAELLLGMQSEHVVGQVGALSLFASEAASGASEAPGHTGHGRWGELRRLARFYRATQNPATPWFMLRADGSKVPVSLAVTRMQDAQGRFAGYLAIASDIRLRLEQEQTLRVAMQQANAANEAKSRFLANMSHEIRTPMNAVLGLSFLLARTALNDEQQSMLRRVQIASKALLAVINDILDLSKIEAGEMALERVPVDLNQIVRDVAALIELQARDKGVAFVVDVPEPVPQPLEGDSTRLQQILINLLSNAIKFTERGEIRLAVRHEALGSGSFRVQMSVSDTGIGIDAEACKRLFAPFVQADLSTTRRYGGTGLGLSIVKQLVEMMHGTVDVESRLGQGSRFVVTLPMHRSLGLLLHPVAVPALPTGQGLPGVRLLVVDDNETNQEIAARILEAEGAVVEVAAHGQAALDWLRARPQGFDAVLMDVHMPVLNGLDATRQIRSSAPFAELPVIGLTAGVSLSEQTEAMDAGMNAVVGKPFDPPVLVRTLWRCLPGLAQRVGAPADTGETANTGEPAAPAPLPEDWPQLPGVQAAQSFARLKGHAPLFWQLARRIRDGVAALPPREDAGAVDTAQLRAQLHDLKGMAGSLGAQAVYGLVAQAEEAAREGENAARASTDPADALDPSMPSPSPTHLPTSLLASLLTQLRAAVQCWDTTLAQADAPPASADAGPREEPSVASLRAVNPGLQARIHALRGALQRQDLAALDEWEALAPDWAEVWGTERRAALQQHMDLLDFGAALQELDAAMPSQPE